MIQIFTDGATEGHNGKLGTVKFCGIGVSCPALNFNLSRRIEAGSNNEAEFWALITAMKWAILEGLTEVEFCSDSQIVVNRANGARPKKLKYQNPRMDKLQNIVLDLANQFQTVSFVWIPRERNWQADALSTASLKNRNNKRKLLIPLILGN